MPWAMVIDGFEYFRRHNNEVNPSGSQYGQVVKNKEREQPRLIDLEAKFLMQQTDEWWQ